MHYTAIPMGVAIIGVIYLIFKYCKYGKDIFAGLAFTVFGFFVKIFLDPFCGRGIMIMGMTLVILTLLQMIVHKCQNDQPPTAYQKLCQEMDEKREKDYINRLDNWSKHAQQSSEK